MEQSSFGLTGVLQRFHISLLSWLALAAGYVACVALGVYLVATPFSLINVLLLCGLMLVALALLILLVATLRGERKQFENTLREKEEKFALVFRHLPVWVIIRDLTDNVYIEANEQVLNDLEYRRHEVIGRTNNELQLFSQEDQLRVQQAVQSSGGFSEIELTVRSKSGRRFTVLSSGERIVINGRACLLVVSVDISSRWHIEQALVANIAQLNLFIENSPVALAMFDRDMKYLHTSKRWLQNYRIEDMSLEGLCHYDMFPEMPEKWKLTHQRGMNGEIVRSEEDSLVRRNGEMVWLRWEVRPWHQADGSVGGIVIFSENITERKVAEATVVERDSMLQQISELARVGASVWDIKANEYYWSPMMRKIHEVEDSTPPSRDVRMNFFPAEVRPKVLSAMTLLMEQGTPIDMELPAITAKGNSIWVHIKGQGIYENGKIIKVVGAYQDITLRKNTDIALRASEEQFRMLVENLQVGLLLKGPSGAVILSNRKAQELLGQTEEQMLGRVALDRDWSVIKEDESSFMVSEYPAHQAIARGEGVNGVVMGIQRPGKPDRIWLQVDAEPLSNADGSIRQVICTFTDITSRKHTEVALRESEERFRQIADNIHEVFWLFDVVEQTVIYVSPAYESIWGRAKQDLYRNPQDWLDAIVPEDRPRIATALANIAHNRRYHETYRITRPDGGVRWIRDQGYAVLTPNGLIGRIVGTAEDITESRLIESQLRQSQRLEAIGTLTGGIAHDFNNILAGIIGFTSLAQQAPGNDPDLKSYLAQIAKASRRAADLVSQILTFSRAQGPELELVKMNELTNEAITLLRAAIPSSIEFETYTMSSLPPVMGNASQLHQIIMNLGTNAWYAMRDQKGQLRISLDVCEVDEVQSRLLSNISPGQYLRLTVQDNGCGMSNDTLERAFEPFFTTKPAGQGTGLGLSVVHGIVRNHLGAISIASELNRGTTIEVLLPAQTEQASVDTATNHIMATQGTGQRILFVDDEPALVQLAEHMLGSLGYQVEGYQDAEKALTTFRSQPGHYDLVITDQTMPRMSGLEFSTQVHAIYPEIPVILVSGYAAAISDERVRMAGVSAVLDKPYSREILAAALHRYLSRHLNQKS